MLLIDILLFYGLKGEHQAIRPGVVNHIPVCIRRCTDMFCFDHFYIVCEFFSFTEKFLLGLLAFIIYYFEK